ncbi:EamA family transporter [Parabacteroides acidifaciens]|uniref:EamA family transporter n=1 Tax=Parabacteroides acidifaciens TaxID=2290935 RepID=A0A3D8HG04_9BACT|nr:EamA family transporter [Parabacteroides acidifaciens]MBC8601410.1 EamA family transporter [Parabacteroides acidifaciens]RDU49905.1 EamA family transporter [Parabacteroides acidifaciens]
MRDAFIKLHISILLAGFTGLFGKLVTLNEGLLVWYRMLLAAVMLFLILWGSGKLKRVPFREVLKIAGTGLLLGLHWVFFYGSIKAANVSIGVVCFSLVGFFTALLEPLIIRRRLSIKEILFSLVAVCGIVLIFQFDTRYRTGIIIGVVSSALAALFTITNKKVGVRHSSSMMLLYEMIGGFLGLTCLLPFYLHLFPVETILPGMINFLYLLLLALVCTIGLYLLQIQVLKQVSAFTVNLSYNLEPVYSIILAMLFFGEAKELSFAFYAGLGLILLSVLLQTWEAIRYKAM